MRTVGCHETHSHGRATVHVEVVYLGHGDAESPTAFGNDWPDKRPFGFQGVHLTEQELEFSDTDPHRGSCYRRRRRRERSVVVGQEFCDVVGNVFRQ